MMNEEKIELVFIMDSLLKEIESKFRNVSIAGGRGGGTGKIYPAKGQGVSALLGSSEYDVKNDENHQNAPVKISKAFRRKK